MTNIVTNEKFNAVVDAVCYWLGYQFKIGRDQLIHEASLRYPIADTLTAKGIAINRVVLEKLHPVFKSKKIDLVIFSENVKEPEAEKDDSNLNEVYEFKLANSKTSEKYSDEHQRVFDDIVRLAYYNLWKNKDCYFLMCGKYEEFKTYFVGQKSTIEITNDKNIIPIRQKVKTGEIEQKIFEEWKPDGLYKDWFGFKIGEEKEAEFNKNENNWGLKSFQNNYHIREDFGQKFSDKIKIKTKCLAITPYGLETSKTHAAGLWKIEAT